jgi:glutaredoxin
MKPIATLITFLLLNIWATSSAVAQKLHDPIDPNSKIAYSDPPTKEQIETATRAESLLSPILTTSASSQIEHPDKLETLSGTSTSTSTVVLYSAVWCGYYCNKAKSYLAGKGITYEEIDIDTNDGGVAFAQAGSGEGVPFLVVGNQSIQGFSDIGYDGLFANFK